MALTSIFDALGRSIEELLKRALNIEYEVSFLHGLVRYVILVQVRLNFLNHRDLLTSFIKRNMEGVDSTEEAFEDLHRVTVERVSLMFLVCKKE